MTQDDIPNALNTLLATLSLPTAWENTSFDPPDTGAHLRPTYMPGETSQMGALPAIAEHVGLYQVDVFGPRDSGDGFVRGVANSILALFPMGLGINANGTTVRITRSYRGPASEEEQTGLFHIPVRIHWRTEI